MRSALIVLLLAAPLFAQLVPRSYVVELQTAPLGILARTRSNAPDALNRRAQIAGEQRKVQSLIEQRNGHVLSSMRNVINAMVVDIPEQDAPALKSISGVKRVFPVTMSHANLDHALPLHHVPQAWARVGGMSKAGLGVKIAVLDTGITPGHPAFQDKSLTPPAGYPIFSSDANKVLTSNKIIVARDYSAIYKPKDPDSIVDHFGHGTNTADCAAGNTAAGPFATITGVAPKAFLGIYKISSGNTGGASSAVIAQAFDDALGDGMDVINLSFGSPFELFSSLQNYVIDEVVRLGVIVVTSAGNSGPAPDTIGDPASDFSAISVGANQNDRLFGGYITVAGMPMIQAATGAYGVPNPPTAAALNDVNSWDPRLGCVALPAGSLTGQIALVTPGPCRFETVLNNFADAGAFAAIFYSASRNAAALSNWTPLTATLPAVYVSNVDGLALRAAVTAAPLTVASVKFEGVAFPNESRALASFSSRGPTEFSALKPDLAATGAFVYMAAQSLDPQGGIYNSTGFTQENGTSYSSPLVAGAAAVLKAARPGLTVDQYRSLIINSASPLILPSGSLEPVRNVGAGTLNLEAAIASTIAVFPTSISFGTGGSNLNNFDYLTVTNVGTASETFTVSAVPFDSAPAPNFSLDGTNVYSGDPGSATLKVTLGPKQSKVVDALWIANKLTAGEYQGLFVVRGGSSGSTAVVPYWYGIPDFVPRFLQTPFGVPLQATVGTRIGLYFKVVDSIGTGILDPSILRVRSSVVTGGGTITGPTESSSYVNYLFLTATLSATPGPNVFQYQIANFAPIQVSVMGMKAPAGGAAPQPFSESAFELKPVSRLLDTPPQ